jgi:hypothetical protein
MMEIIQQWQPEPEKTYTVTCWGCKTIYRFKESEGQITYDQRGGDFITIACPVCEKKVAILTGTWGGEKVSPFGLDDGGRCG